MAEVPRFLLVGDSTDEYSVKMLRETLSAMGVVHLTAEEGLTRRLEGQAYDAVIVDAGAVMAAEATVTQVLEQSPMAEVFVITASPHWRVAREVFRAGAADYMPKTRLNEDLLISLRTVAERVAGAREDIVEDAGG